MRASTATVPKDRATVSIPEAARILGISDHAAYRAVKAGVIPTIPLGPQLNLVPVAELRKMLGLTIGGDAA